MRPAGGISSSFRQAGDDASLPAAQPGAATAAAMASSPLALRPTPSSPKGPAPRNASLPPRGLSASAPPLNQHRCADIGHPQWHPLAPALQRFATARMRKALAQEEHFGAAHLRQQGGICSGVSNVWLRLHHAQPDAQSSVRLAILTSEPGIAQATIAQRLYLAEVEWHTSELPAGASPEADAMTETLRLFEAGQPSAKATMGLALQPRLDRPSRRTGDEIAASILRHEGYAECVVELQAKDSGQLGGHSIASFNPGGGRPVTICDSNLGEFVVPSADLPEFLRAWAAAYGTSPPPVGKEPYAINDIAVYPVRVDGDIATTPLASLGEDLRAAGRASGHAAPEGASSSQPGAMRGAG